ncbi:metallophosphoesterase family protein [Cohnella faecalis]|uniref:metallophosphoesterase family protein n=1 Tax=Cohnella faecalis TaxID=2315694 RepID=UPI001314056D|nr:metallophosphoesterase [Cohnella faecalis]
MVDIDEQYEQELDKAVKVLSAKQNESTLNFVFVTDLHHIQGGNQLRAARIIRELAARLPLDFILNGGDSCINAAKDVALAAQREIFEALRAPGVPLLTVKGNHDDNSIYGHERPETRAGHVIYPAETKALIQEGIPQAARWDESCPDSLYYYLDVEAKQTRVIVLDTMNIPYEAGSDGRLPYLGQWEYAFSSRQLNWLAHEALNLTGKPDWRVLIASHVEIIEDGVFGTDHPVANGEALWEIVKAFQSGSPYSLTGGEGDFAYAVEGDFSPQGKGKVIGCLFGHVHFDQTVYQDGIPMVSSLNACTRKEFPDCPEREPDTLSETALDIVTIDFERSRIDTYRFGAGEHRTVSF